MTTNLKNFRLIDANLNRLREGIRVLEDISRYIYDDKETAKKLKKIRHLCKVKYNKELLENRNIKTDVLKKSIHSEKKRKNIYSITRANFKRTQESSRVLEEFFKLKLFKKNKNFKKIRYQLYDLEKAFIKITSNSK